MGHPKASDTPKPNSDGLKCVLYACLRLILMLHDRGSSDITGDRGRAKRACDACKQRELKCNGHTTCQQCSHLNLRCTYTE
ncbi:hypothetical protein V1517DRAFT_332287 [Lipomyces orientalis]|uniref:Uncharacterized protein n=1 Tax=Lipomyces orientalis TaxID=1233043 RepID=A0ACC3TED5_9ASCO